MLNYFSDDIVHGLTVGWCHLKFAVYNKTRLVNSDGGLAQNVIHQPKLKRYCIDLLPICYKAPVVLFRYFKSLSSPDLIVKQIADQDFDQENKKIRLARRRAFKTHPFAHLEIMLSPLQTNPFSATIFFVTSLFRQMYAL